ncbi:uncharacterized protein [Phaseolus vulgaris]|uniref:Uncharacterized protein n=1 Tax=Phaseolus vulgaris TaxID=3885 RepID=V7B8W5_PHAVU|nr:hypothetical protein PHAVU_008G265600g [Phaseolus vulgaris]XP_007142258.1 hypothetical protein PHAVU_008G265600g [Phaseolus vulgaris]ESW14249.1 hypothetical protein PHAVU_008G265600g [Phaseolus vulgaris]ESW14252.1 hypothetical protein PHAVU_008G265600g [Phaseolus vulgaris]
MTLHLKSLDDNNLCNRSLNNCGGSIHLKEWSIWSMAQTVEVMKGGGGSIRLGTTGTISSLMTRELDHVSSAPKKMVSSTRSKTQTLPVSVPCGSATQKRLQPRKSSVEAGCSGSSKSTNRRVPGNGMPQKAKTNGRNTQTIPMLGSDKCSVGRTPVREKNDKKIPNIVEVVDIKCGNAEKAWATPLASRLKKLGFSKLSESII